MDLSILVPTTGRWSLATALSSADASALECGLRAELIVIDDRLHTAEPLDIPSELYSRVRVVNSGGRGLPAARNTGWAAASGTFVALLDDDDAVCAHHFCTLIEACEAYPSMRGAYSGVNNIVRAKDASGRIRVSASLSFGWHFNEAQLQVANTIIPSSVILRRAGRPIVFDENLNVQEDWEAWLCLLSRGERLKYTGHATSAYSKDTIAPRSATVRASCELEVLRYFARGYDALCYRYPTAEQATLDARRRMRDRYQNWQTMLIAGMSLPVNYYEMSLAEEFGDASAFQCCSLSNALYRELRERENRSRSIE